jgi:hypothetical protein
MGAIGTLGSVNAQFTADTQQFDPKMESMSAKMAEAAQKAEQLGQKLTETGAAADRAASVQERAAERARRAWQQELIQQDRAIQADQESARSKELAALKADILSRSLEKQATAQNAVNAAVEHGIPQTAAASAAIRVLEGGMNNNVRAAERFLSTTLGLGPALQVLFPIAGGIAFLDILFKMGAKLIEIAQNWEGVKDAENAAMSALEKTDQEVVAQGQEHSRLTRELQMAQVGLSTPREGRAAAMQAVGTQFDIIDAKTKLSDLDIRIQSGQNQIDALDLQRRSQQTRLVTKYGTADGKFDPTKNPVPVYEPTTDARWAKAKMVEIGGAMEAAQKERRTVAAQIVTLQAQLALYKKEQAEGAGRGERKDAGVQMGIWRQQLEAQKAGHTMTIDDEADYWQKLADSVRRGSVLYNDALAEANRSRAESVKQYQASYISSVLENQEAQRAQEAADERLHSALEENYVGQDARDREGAKHIQEAAIKAFDAAEEQRKAADRIAEEAIRLQEASGRLSRAGAAQALQTLHEESFKGWSAAATSFSVQFPNVAVPGAAQAVQEYGLDSAKDQAAHESADALGSLREATDKLTQAFLDLPAHVQELLTSTVNGFNSAFSSAVMAHENSGSEYRRGITNAIGGQFRSAGARGLDTALQLGEGSLLGKLGFGKPKADGSQSNPLWVRIAAGAGVAGGEAIGPSLLGWLGALGPAGTTGRGAGNPLETVMPALTETIGGSTTSGTASASSVGKTTTGIVSTLLGLIPHLATGGPLPSNMPALVGENGPELFMPSSSGRIVPNDQLGGGGGSGHTFNIDARGATDPAAVGMQIERAVNALRAQVPAIAIAAHIQHNRMRPGTSRI